AWRSLQDTADAAPLTYYGGGGWANWRRGTDFYPEGQLLWLDVDTKIRELSGGKHSLDDFAHAFYGMENGSYVTKTYTFDDVVNTLNQVQPFDWAKFLRARLDYTGAELPEHGITRGGWKLVYTDQPNAETKAMEGIRHGVNLAASIGLSASKTGNIYDVQWNGPAFKAGLVPGLTIVAVDGKDYSPDALKDAITAAACVTRTWSVPAARTCSARSRRRASNVAQLYAVSSRRRQGSSDGKVRPSHMMTGSRPAPG